MTISWVGFDSFPDLRINAMYPLVMGTTQLLLETVNLLGQRIKKKNNKPLTFRPFGVMIRSENKKRD